MTKWYTARPYEHHGIGGWQVSYEGYSARASTKEQAVHLLVIELAKHGIAEPGKTLNLCEACAHADILHKNTVQIGEEPPCLICRCEHFKQRKE